MHPSAQNFIKHEDDSPKFTQYPLNYNFYIETHEVDVLNDDMHMLVAVISLTWEFKPT